MKLSKNFVVHKSKKETLLVPLGGTKFSGVVKVNDTAAVMLKLLENDVSETEIVNALHKIYDAPDGKIESDVKRVLGELRKIGAIDD